MLEILKKQIENAESDRIRIYLLREYLQILILKGLYDLKAFQNISFMGGTALRIIHGVQRYSEDLDFALDHPAGYDANKIAAQLQRMLTKHSFETEIKIRQKVVDVIEVKFPLILNSLGISQHPGEKLMIKIEIDTNPPPGGETESHIIQAPFLFMLRAYNLASIFAGKLHASLFRKYVKGRDYYDIFWLLSRKIQPNLVFFKNAVLQTEEKEIEPELWKELLKRKLASLDLNKIRSDTRIFLRNPEEADLLNRENFLNLLQNAN